MNTGTSSSLRLATLRVLPALAVFLLASPTLADIAIEEVGPMSSRNQAAWWSPIGELDGNVYVSYLAPNSPQDDVFVAKRSAGGTWEVGDTGVDSRYDVGHTQTSLGFDSTGHLHIMYGMHGDPMRIVRSDAPGSVTSGFTVETGAQVAAFSGGDYTYPNLTTTPDGDLYLIVRDRRSGYGDQNGRLFRYGADNQWSEMPPFAGQSGTTVYPDHITSDADGNLHIVWEWAAGGPQGSRHYGSYAKFDPTTQTYYRADGTPYAAGPIDIAEADIFQGLVPNEVFQSGVHGFQSAKMVLDDENRPMVAYSQSLDGTASGYEHRFARWDGTEWLTSTITTGPFDIDKPWITYSDGKVRYYGTLSPDDPSHTGSDDIFLRVSDDLGTTWSEPTQVTSGLNVQRPMGVTVGDTDYLYLPDISAQKLYLGIVEEPYDVVTHPPQPITKEIGFQHGTSPDVGYEYQHILIRNDTNLADTPQVNSSILVGTKANTVAEPDSQGELRTLLQFDLSAFGAEAGAASLLSVALDLNLIERQSLPRIDGSPTIDLYTYESPFSTTTSTWNDPDGDGDAETGDTTPGGTLGTLVASLGEIDESTSFDQTFASSVEFVAAVEQALATDGQLRLIMVERDPELATRDIAFFHGTNTGNHSRLPRLAIVVSQLFGDYNEDGVVDAADYTVWRNNLGATTQLANESPTASPGEVTMEDYLVWKSNFGRSLPALLTSNTQSVPEPSPASWILISTLGCLAWRLAASRNSPKGTREI